MDCTAINVRWQSKAKAKRQRECKTNSETPPKFFTALYDPYGLYVMSLAPRFYIVFNYIVLKLKPLHDSSKSR